MTAPEVNLRQLLQLLGQYLGVVPLYLQLKLVDFINQPLVLQCQLVDLAVQGIRR